MEQAHLIEEINLAVKDGREKLGSAIKPEMLQRLAGITHLVTDFTIDPNTPYLDALLFLSYTANSQVDTIRRLEAHVDGLITEIMKAAMGIKPVSFRYPYAPLDTVKNTPPVLTYPIQTLRNVVENIDRFVTNIQTGNPAEVLA